MGKKLASQLVQYAQRMLGMPYWYGTYGKKASASLLASKTKQYPAHYPSGMNAQRQADIKAGKPVHDCVGLIKGFGWMNDAGTITYASNGVKDQSANGLYSAAKVKGGIKTMPDVPGLAVRYDGHVGIHIGGGYVIEARGRNYGVVKTKLSSRPWTHWFEIPYIDYSGTATEPKPGGVFGEYAIQRGEKGENVRTLQTLLNKAGAKLMVDGDFGPATEAAVKAYQKRIGVTQTGIADVATIKRLIMDTTEDRDSSDQIVPQEPTKAGRLRVTGNSVHIRTGPADPDRFGSVAIAKKGDTLTAYLDQNGKHVMVDGWYAVILDGPVRWISGKYVEV